MLQQWLRRQWFALSAGLFCFAWALLGLLTVIPNQDILADGIQAQSILKDPRIVLSFPGQKHGGPLEYPFTLLAEYFAPGNWYVNGAIRPVLAFATGFVVATLFLRLFPGAPRWAFLSAIAVGPAILHGLLGPESNPVGVWWLQPNWDMAWLLVLSGALILACVLGTTEEHLVPSSTARRTLWSLAAGLLVGLGFFAHPAISLLIVPLIGLVLLRCRWSARMVLTSTCGAIVGVVPAAISYVVNTEVNTWDPSHGAFIAIDYYLSMGGSVLGLDGIPDYMRALLPYALGLEASSSPSVGKIQSALMWLFVLVILTSSAIAMLRVIRHRQRVSPAGAVALSWLIAFVTIFGFITFIDPVWIYSAGLSFLGLLTVGALPALVPRCGVGIVLAVAVIAGMALSTIMHNGAFYGDVPSRIREKAEVMEANDRVANELVSAGVQYVYGSYYDVIPIGYASGSRLRTVTNHYNRFPVRRDEESLTPAVVAVPDESDDEWGREALGHIKAACQEADVRAKGFAVFVCPLTVLREMKR